MDNAIIAKFEELTLKMKEVEAAQQKMQDEWNESRKYWPSEKIAEYNILSDRWIKLYDERKVIEQDVVQILAGRYYRLPDGRIVTQSTRCSCNDVTLEIVKEYKA